jgi:hypothetical protein
MYSRETCLVFVFPYFCIKNAYSNVKRLLSKLTMLTAFMRFRLPAVEDTGAL